MRCASQGRRETRGSTVVRSRARVGEVARELGIPITYSPRANYGVQESSGRLRDPDILTSSPIFFPHGHAQRETVCVPLHDRPVRRTPARTVTHSRSSQPLSAFASGARETRSNGTGTSTSTGTGTGTGPVRSRSRSRRWSGCRCLRCRVPVATLCWRNGHVVKDELMRTLRAADDATGRADLGNAEGELRRKSPNATDID